MHATDLIIIANNLRSAHNVGSLMRTCEGIGVSKLYLCGYTPYPLSESDDRLPHIAQKADRQIVKTSLGAEKSLPWEHFKSAAEVIGKLKQQGYEIVALEQTSRSIDLEDYTSTDKTAIVIGREVEGLEPAVIDLCDKAVEIKMAGDKESFNVVIAAAIAAYAIKHKG